MPASLTVTEYHALDFVFTSAVGPHVAAQKHADLIGLLLDDSSGADSNRVNGMGMDSIGHVFSDPVQMYPLYERAVECTLELARRIGMLAADGFEEFVLARDPPS